MLLALLAAVVITAGEPSVAALAPRFVQVQAALPGEQPTYEGWSRAQLETEVRRLEDERPGVGGPVSMLVVGAVVGVIDLVVFMFGGLIALSNGGGFDPGFTIGVSVAAVVAAGLLILGGVLLRGLLAERAGYTRQLELVKAALERLTAPPVPPPPNGPPGQLFQQVRAAPPLIAVTLARF